MSDPSPAEGHDGEVDSQTPQSEDDSGIPADSPAVAAAKTSADSRISKAEIARTAAARKDAYIGVPLVGALVIAALVILIWWMLSEKSSGNPPPVHWGWGLGFAGAAVAILTVGGVRGASRAAEYAEICRAEDFNVRAAELDYAPETDAPLAANRALLQEYHRLSTNQARSAFKLAQWVMGTAAVLVLAGALAVALARNTATAVTLASLTAFISALSGYISSTLLATYRVSVEQARFYFREPLAGGYLLAAEHLAKRLDPPDHTAALGRVVDGFIQAAVNTPASAQGDPQQKQGELPASPAPGNS